MYFHIKVILVLVLSWEPALWLANSQERVPKNHWHFQQRLLSIDMKTNVVQHVESEWMRDWKSVRVRECECERVIVTFEHRHENESCSACPNDHLKCFQSFLNCQVFRFSKFSCATDGSIRLEVVKNGNTSMIFVATIFVLISTPFSYLRTVGKFKDCLRGQIIAFLNLRTVDQN